MYTPSFTCLRMTAYHSVEASLEPWIRSHGFGGSPLMSISPASSSCPSVAA